MSVLIKGMKMPANCQNCFASDDESRFCRAAKKYIPMLGKPKFCPLIELPDHGDLIDESETVEAQYYDDEHEEWSIKTKTVGDVLAEICEVPPKVVIPTERDEASICDNCDERSDVGCSWCRRMERSEE